MADWQAAGASSALAFMMAAGLVYEIIAAACSSPQTTEINASSRAKTLMKWVHLGIGQAAIFVGIAAWIAMESGGSPLAVIAGGALATTIMYACYWHAKKAGLKSKQRGTEY
jgi:hypothetical protein